MQVTKNGWSFHFIWFLGFCIVISSMIRQDLISTIGGSAIMLSVSYKSE